ncbi:MAG: prepilin-type N-terminal cleavage/methylation domain-containing protein [Pseudomonadales bacterium]|nr:prepilin-type N-terminal cleavage/methylation domain-containing protein [Pseudomonadales bacterium]
MTLPYSNFLRSNSQKYKILGFTLVEMIVTIAIMLVVTGGGIAAFINFNDKQNVQVAVKDLQTLLRSAQTKARVGEDAQLCNTVYNNSLRGYRVFIGEGTNTAILSTSCASDKFDPADNRNYVERSRITFDSSVTAKMLGDGDVNIEFLSLLGGTDGTGTVVISGLTDVYQFEVSQSGEITEGQFQ